MEYVVLGVQKWDIKEEKLEGISVHYIDPASPADSEDSIGFLPAKLTADKKLMDSFTTLPGRYMFDIGLKRIAGGKTGVELNSVKYVGSVDFSSTKPYRPQMEAARKGLEIAKDAAKETAKQ